jgi:hypothetical protein
MAIDPTSSVSNAVITQRAHAAPATSAPRILNATRVSSSGSAGNNITAFAVPQTSKSGSSKVKLPRGSIVDVLA